MHLIVYHFHSLAPTMPLIQPPSLQATFHADLWMGTAVLFILHTWACGALVAVDPIHQDLMRLSPMQQATPQASRWDFLHARLVDYGVLCDYEMSLSFYKVTGCTSLYKGLRWTLNGVQHQELIEYAIINRHCMSTGRHWLRSYAACYKQSSS